MNKKPFQAVLSSPKSDRESFSITDCYVMQYANPKGIQVPGSISFKKFLKEAWKIASSIFKMPVKLWKSTLAAEENSSRTSIECLVRGIM